MRVWLPWRPKLQRRYRSDHNFWSCSGILPTTSARRSCSLLLRCEDQERGCRNEHDDHRREPRLGSESAAVNMGRPTSSDAIALVCGAAPDTGVPTAESGRLVNETIVDRARVSIGRPRCLRITHSGGCRIHSAGALSEWHRFDAAFESDSFRATVCLEMPIAFLVSFREELVALNRDIRGSAKLETVERDLMLMGEVDKLGHIEWTGSLCYPSSIPESTLTFTIQDDQTSLAGIIAQVDALVTEARGWSSNQKAL